MKTYEITEKEAEAILAVLKTNWIPLDLQKIVFELIQRLEKQMVT